MSLSRLVKELREVAHDLLHSGEQLGHDATLFLHAADTLEIQQRMLDGRWKPEERGLLYLHLFHGRKDLGQDMDEWGEDGPVLAVYGFIDTYRQHPRVIDTPNPDDDAWHEIIERDGCLYYDGMWYGDYSVFSGTVDKHLRERAVLFDPSKAALPIIDPPLPREAFDKALAEAAAVCNDHDASGVPASNEDLESMVNDLADVIERVLIDGDYRYDGLLDDVTYEITKESARRLWWWAMKGRLLTGTAPDGYTLPEKPEDMPL